MLCLINGALFLLAIKLTVGHKYIECIDTGSSSPTSSIWTQVTAATPMSHDSLHSPTQ